MPDVEQLHLEDALEDSPQTRHLLSVFEQDSMLLKKFSEKMHNCCQRIVNGQHEMFLATQSLAHHLRSYETKKCPLEPDDSVLTSTLKHFSSYLDDMNSVQRVLGQQLSESMMHPLSKFLQADMEEISRMCEKFKMSTHDHEQAMSKYMKVTSKKDEKSRLDVNEELFQQRKKFHQTALHYYSSLNSLQYKRKCFLLEPIMGYLHSQQSCFQMGQDIILRSDMDEFLGNIGTSVQSVHADLAKETQKTVELIDSIEQQSNHQYHVEPLLDMPFIPPNTNLTQKAGYLFCRGKQALLTTKWERLYYFTQGGNLMSQTKEEFAGSLVVDLNEDGVVVDSIAVDDRRNTFQISSVQAKKVVILQAENYRERDEWIATMNNIMREGGYICGKPASVAPTAKKDPPKQMSSNSNSTSPESASASSPQSPIKPSQSISSLSSVGTGDLVLDTPIQFDFDIDPPGEENRVTPSQLSGPPKRLNPFDQSSVKVLNPAFDNAAFSETVTIRFLGSMEVKGDRGEQLVHDTIRQIMAARAIRNILKMTESLMIVSSEGIRLIDPSNNVVRVEFALQDISFWSAHPDNNRFFGFITRNRIAVSNNADDDGKTPPSAPSFACHVFESNSTAEDICKAISIATKIAYQALMEKRKGLTKPAAAAAPVAAKANNVTTINEKTLLLKNIQNVTDRAKDEEEEKIHDDEDDNANIQLPLSPDGKYLILNTLNDPDTQSSVTPSDAAAPPSPDVKDDEDSESEA